jgi:hypothetical protein
MSMFYDQPVWIVVFGIISVAILAVIWAQTGRNGWLYAAGGVFALTLALLGLERYLVSDTEALRATVRQIAADVAKNNPQLVYPHLHSAATGLRQKADAEIPNYEFTECTVTRVYVLEVDETKSPLEGRVEFMVRVSGSFSYQGAGANGTFLRYVTLFFGKEADGKWRIKDYQHRDPQTAWLNTEGKNIP